MSSLMSNSENPAVIFLEGFKQSTRRAYQSSLEMAAAILTETPGKGDIYRCAWHRIRVHHMKRLRAVAAKMRAPATVNKMLSAVRGVLKVAVQQGTIPSDEYLRCKQVENLPVETLRADRRVDSEEVRFLMDVCASDRSPKGIRDAAMIAILYHGALERAELMGLDLSDYRYGADPPVLRVRNGRRNKERAVPMSDFAVELLEQWLMLRGQRPGPMFLPVRRGGHIKHNEGRMTPQALYCMIKERVDQAALKTLSPRDFRGTCLTILLDEGADISSVKRFAGHASAESTVRYDRRGEEETQKIVDLLSDPRDDGEGEI